MVAKYDPNNIFAKIIRGEIPSDKIYEDGDILAFNDIAKAAPKHILVIPKGEYVNFGDFVTKAPEDKVVNFFKKIKEIAQTAGLEESGYRIITNSGPDASQTVLHFHVHITGGRALGGLLPDNNQIR